MRSKPQDAFADSDNVETLPAEELPLETGTPISDSWDSEAPTAVHALRPLFAGPPRLPTP
jgi:hypothetical protein